MNFFFKKWWVKSKGKSTALVVTGFSVGGFIFAEFVTNFINPDNVSPDKPYSVDEPDEKLDSLFFQYSIFVSIFFKKILFFKDIFPMKNFLTVFLMLS